jgi:hypothetical protein
MSRTQRVSSALLTAGLLLTIGCEEAAPSGAGTGGAGAVAGMVGSGGMMSTGGAAGMVASGGAGGVVNMAPGGPPTFTAIFSEILTKGSAGNCTFGACHGAEPGPTNGMLKLVSTDQAATHAALVNVASASGVCGTATLVVPGQPEASLLLQKLRPAPPCGLQMPVAGLGTYLSEGQLNQISTWIQNGALND